MDRTNQDNSVSFVIKEQSLMEQRVNLLYRGTPLTILTSLLLGIVLTYSQWDVIGRGDLVLWNIVMFCMMVLRTGSWLFWRNADTTLNTNYWLTSFRVGTLLAGISWGSASYFMFANYNPTYQALLAFTLAGVASASLTSLAIDRIAAVGFVVFAIVPLNIRLYVEHDQIAISMNLMVMLFIIFVLSTTERARKAFEDNHLQNLRLIDWGNDRIQQQQMSKVISEAQTLFIATNHNQEAFEYLLNNILTLNNSEFGFIAKTCDSNTPTPYLEMLAMTNIAWDTNSNEVYTNNKNHGMKFTNLNTLFGVALTSGKPIISNNPATDMRASGTPKGHQSITAFIGIPIFNNNQQVAMLGLANKKNGYTEIDIENLKPITHVIVQFITALTHKRQHIIDAENIEYQARYRQAILDAAFDGIITINATGIITSFNHAAEVIFGYSSINIINHNIQALLTPKVYGKLFNNNIIKNLKDIVGINHELIGLRKNGKEFEMEFVLSTIAGEDENYVGIIRDISERKHIEKLKNEFISTVSHELRTPLTSISASLAIIESGSLGNLPEKIDELIKIAKQNSMRLQNFINDLLDMDKLLSNEIDFSYSNIDALKLVEKAMDANQYLANKYRVKFQIVSAEAGCYCITDESRTQQVLSHLLSNAAKFSNPNSVVDLSIFKINNFIKIVITDYGSGIPSEFKPTIFSRFRQADSSSTRKKEGSGIGLAISKQLIEQMGGNIGFSSTLGTGSSFYFELPAALTSNEQ